MLLDLAAPDFPWIALSVAIPLFAALIAALSSALAPVVAMIAALLCLGAALWTAVLVTTHGAQEVAVGAWPPPLGIVLRADGLAVAMLITAGLVSIAAFAFARQAFSARTQTPETRSAYSFWPLGLCVLAGVNAAFVSNDLFNLYVALELTTIAAAALVAMSGSRAAFEAAIRYLMFALLGSLFYLLGVVLTYSTHGVLDIRLLAISAESGPSTIAAAALMSAGLMTKMALFPLHAWLPPAHSAAPAPASALLSALVVKPPFVILLRIWFEAMPELVTPTLAQAFGALGACGVLLGSILAMRQERLKLVVAYSTVAQLGYLVLVFPLAGGGGAQQPWAAGAWTGAIFLTLSHALAKGAMFLAAGAFVEARGNDRLDSLVGLAREMPISCFAFGLAAVSLMGLPPSGGFTGKYLLLTSSFASGQWWWGIVLVVGGLLSAVYLFGPLSLMFAREPALAVTPVSRARQSIALLLGLLSILLGLFSEAPYRLLQVDRPGAAAEGFT